MYPSQQTLNKQLANSLLETDSESPWHRALHVFDRPIRIVHPAFIAECPFTQVAPAARAQYPGTKHVWHVISRWLNSSSSSAKIRLKTAGCVPKQTRVNSSTQGRSGSPLPGNRTGNPLFCLNTVAKHLSETHTREARTDLSGPAARESAYLLKFNVFVRGHRGGESKRVRASVTQGKQSQQPLKQVPETGT